MQLKATIVALALAASSRVSAQGIDSLPDCALQPAIAAIGSTGCDLTDIKCICSAKSFVVGLQPVIQKACSPADLATTVQAATALCKSVGVDLPIPSSASAAPVSSPSVAPGPVSESSTTPATTSTSTSVATTTTVIAGTGTGTGVPVPPTNGTTIATPTPTATIIPGAAANVGVQSGLLALAGAAAMFFAL